ncbi:MAG: hypothetical protein IJX18_03505 [Clostridia bacterium]|nr:hypothetical protein [Clostridia bacterium]
MNVKQVFFPLSGGIPAGGVSVISAALRDYAVEHIPNGRRDPELTETKFAEEIAQNIQDLFFNEGALCGLFWAVAFDKTRAYWNSKKDGAFACFGVKRTTGKTYLNDVITRLVRAWAARYITLPAYDAWVYSLKKYTAAENGFFENESETTAQGTNENASTGSTALKFSSGVTTASAGTNNQTDTTETTSGLTTGKTTQKTKQGFARDYNGDLDAFNGANLAANIAYRIAQKFFTLVISVEELDAAEIGDPAKIVE